MVASFVIVCTPNSLLAQYPGLSAVIQTLKIFDSISLTLSKVVNKGNFKVLEVGNMQLEYTQH